MKLCFEPDLDVQLQAVSTSRKYGGTSRSRAATRNNSRLGISGEFGQREPHVPRFAGVLSSVQRTLDVAQQRVHTRQRGGLATALAAHRDHARPVTAPGRSRPAYARQPLRGHCRHRLTGSFASGSSGTLSDRFGRLDPESIESPCTGHLRYKRAPASDCASTATQVRGRVRALASSKHSQAD